MRAGRSNTRVRPTMRRPTECTPAGRMHAGRSNTRVRPTMRRPAECTPAGRTHGSPLPCAGRPNARRPGEHAGSPLPCAGRVLLPYWPAASCLRLSRRAYGLDLRTRLPAREALQSQRGRRALTPKGLPITAQGSLPWGSTRARSENPKGVSRGSNGRHTLTPKGLPLACLEIDAGTRRPFEATGLRSVPLSRTLSHAGPVEHHPEGRAPIA